MRLLDPQNGPEHDLPAPGDPPRRYLVASIPRTGSTLLCRALSATRRAGDPKEYLNAMQLRDWERRMGSPWSRLRHAPLQGRALALVGPFWTEARIEAHLARVMLHRSIGGWFGLKLHHHHLGRLPRGFLESLTCVLRITRRDKLAQAVSWARALQSGRWSSTQGRGGRAVYSRRLIQGRLDEIARQEEGWARTLDRRGLPVLDLVHEDLVARRQAEVRRALARLDVPDAAEVAVPEPDTERQADHTNAAWILRFLNESGSPRRGG